ncbi:MAG: hypothetical protein J2P28_19180 [Actinobacteria bacterium]|nr:hypothetical protein [Actinomycetota bacterium]MBO0837615.1 hypothetical protein [Actinomycetota bacterium]
MSAREGSPESGDPRRNRDPRNVPGSSWVPTSPPISFPVYGLDGLWPGARWLHSFGDQVGDAPRWVELAHQSANGDSLIMVESYSRPVTDDLAARRAEPLLADVVSRAASVLINVTLPVQSTPRPDGCLRMLGAHVTEFAGQYAQWPTVGWRVDGAPVAARASWFASGWAAVSDAVAEVYLSVVGLGADPDGLSLTRLQDGAAYHFDLEQPLRAGVLPASSGAAGLQFEAPPWQRQDWHADQLRLMRESGRTSAE